MNDTSIKYKITECIIDSCISPEFLRSNFEDYIISSKEKANVKIKLEGNEVTIPAIAKDIDDYKYYQREKNVHTYYYKNNVYVEGCSIKFIDEEEMDEIKLFIKLEDDFEKKALSREITYAFMDSFYLYLVFMKKICVHSCSFVIRKKGIIVSGQPGSGKSTLVKKISKKANIEIVGEDINACDFELNFFGMPWCRVNKNVAKKIDAIIFLGNETKELHREEIVELLLQSEFSLNWIDESKENINKLADILVSTHNCFMIENKKDSCTIDRFEKLVKEIAKE